MKRLLFCMMVIVLMGSCDTMRYGVDRSKVMKVWVNEDSLSVDLLMEAYGDEEVYVKMVCGRWDTVMALGDGADVRCDMLKHELKIYGAVEGLRCSLNGGDYDTEVGLDVSGNSGLKSLNCGYSNVATLILGEQPRMDFLDCHDNAHLRKLDVSGCPELTFLDCSINKIEELDVSNCPKLERLECSVNDLRQLDLGVNRNLMYFMCLGNELVELDVSGCEKLVDFDCSENKLERLVMGSHPDLHEMDCMENRLRSLDVTGCPKLWSLLCGENEMHEIDVSKNGNLWRFGYDEDKIDEVDWVNEEAAKNM